MVSFLLAAPETVALYLVAFADTHQPATLTPRLTSIAKAHATAGHPNPASTRQAVVAEAVQGIRRTLCTAQPGKSRSSPLTSSSACPSSLRPCRDVAMACTRQLGR